MNQYKIMTKTNVKPEWFKILVNTVIENCRTSNDGLLVLLKLPKNIQSVFDVPEKWKNDYLTNEPYMSTDETKKEMKKLNWIPDKL